MLITLDEPSMALNDTRAPVAAQMWNTRTVQPTDSMVNVFSDVVRVAKGAPGGKLKNLVFCCHGRPSYLEMGDGIDGAMTIMFRMLVASGGSPLVDTIWFRSCRVARIEKPGDAYAGDGNLFCSEIAQYAKCDVVASTAGQRVWSTGGSGVLPYGVLDGFEGVTLRYGPSGNVKSWERNSSIVVMD